MKKRRRLSICLATACCALSLAPLTGCDLLGFNSTDYEAWSKNIVETSFLSAMSVEVTERKMQYDTLQAQGSGMIFYQSDTLTSTVYYLLTNNHVVQKRYTNGTFQCMVYDAYDNSYSAGVVYQNAEYDLAVLQFLQTKDESGAEVQLAVTSLASNNPTTAQPLATIGNPEGRHNCVTYGKVSSYQTVSVSQEDALSSRVQFPVLTHTCYTKSGSSGGGIINVDMQLVGIHFACGYDKNGDFSEGYAIPAEKIREFLLLAEEKTGKELGV